MPLVQQFDATLQLLHKVLDLRSQKQQIISANIANADTPGYSPNELKFEEELRQAVQDGTLRPVTTHPGHFPLSGKSIDQVSGTLVSRPDTSGIGDENGVRVDQEMIDMAENQILYEAAAQMLKKKIGILKYVVQDGK